MVELGTMKNNEENNFSQKTDLGSLLQTFLTLRARLFTKPTHEDLKSLWTQ